ncbi:hypothetical protein Aduo_013218 [Ancylostoma duodenale]
MLHILGSAAHRKQLYDDPSTPLIVAWTTFFHINTIENVLKPLRNCTYKCGLIKRSDMALYERQPSAYIIHHFNLNSSDLPEANPEHLVIFLSLEAPPYTGTQLFTVLPDYFNATITYRRDSHYFHPYGHFPPLQAGLPADAIFTEEQVKNALRSKVRGSLILISHCNSDSRREYIIQELARYTEITVGGNCENRWKGKFGLMVAYLSRSTFTDDELIESHRFYISFENSVCKDYITEKYFLRLSQLLVPVVLKRSILEDAGLPSSSFIALDDFATVRELGEYLNHLRSDDAAYLRYFEWTKSFAKPVLSSSNVLCELCRDIHLKKKLVLEDIVKYYIKDQCSGSEIALNYADNRRKDILDSDLVAETYVDTIFRERGLNPLLAYTRSRTKF